MQYHITTRVVNTLRNYLQEDDYFFTENKFILKHLKIGPFVKNKEYTVKIASLINKNIQFPHSHSKMVKGERGTYYYEMDFNSNSLFNYDIKLECSAFKFKFYCWNNLYFSTIENISQYIMKNELISKTAQLSNNKGEIDTSQILINSPPSNKSIISITNSTDSKNSNFADMMKKGLLKQDDQEYLALEFVSPVTLLIHIFDRQPEREAEVLEKIRKHFERFVKTYGEEESAC